MGVQLAPLTGCRICAKVHGHLSQLRKHKAVCHRNNSCSVPLTGSLLCYSINLRLHELYNRIVAITFPCWSNLSLTCVVLCLRHD